MTDNLLPTQELTILSPEWIRFKKEQFKLEKNNEATKMLDLIEGITAVPPMIDEVDILVHYTWDRSCKTCHGRGRLGINRIPTKEKGSFYQLQLCHCATQSETDYLKLEKKMMEQFRSTQHADMEIFRALYRHTLFGGLKYGYATLRGRFVKLIGKVKKAVQRKSTTAEAKK